MQLEHLSAFISNLLQLFVFVLITQEVGDAEKCVYLHYKQLFPAGSCLKQSVIGVRSSHPY